MSDNDSRMLKRIWRNLKRALVTAPDIQSELSPFHLNSSNNTDNLPGNNGGNGTVVASSGPANRNTNSTSVGTNNDFKAPDEKRPKLNIATAPNSLTPDEENSFMEVMKNLLSCSICLEVNTYSNQCPNGHLICITCSGRLQQVAGDLNCPVCRVSLKQGLHRSLLAEQITSELPSTCRFCQKIMPVKVLKRHESSECNKRRVPCKYRLFGCDWTGISEFYNDHIESCFIANKNVSSLHDAVMANIEREAKTLSAPLQIWKSIVGKIRGQTSGSRILMRQTTLNKEVITENTLYSFKSPSIRLPFTCCHSHGFYLEIRIRKLANNHEKIEYSLKSENKTKITLNYFLSNFRLDDNSILDITDTLHTHHFESNHKQSKFHDIHINKSDLGIRRRVMSNSDNILVELCIVSERERSERTHGVINANEEDGANQTTLPNATDNNVLFTLFSPSAGARTMNGSNVTVVGSEDGTIINDADGPHDEDLIITVGDDAENAENGASEAREPITRNNHSYVAVPTVFYNPNQPILPFSPFPLENSGLPNFNYLQTPMNILGQNRDPMESELLNPPSAGFFNIINQDNDQYQLSANQDNLTQQINSPINEAMQTNDSNRYNRDPLQMSLLYPHQTFLRPLLSNPIPPMNTMLPTLPRNLILHPRLNIHPTPHTLTSVTSTETDNEFTQVVSTTFNNELPVPTNTNFNNESTAPEVESDGPVSMEQGNPNEGTDTY